MPAAPGRDGGRARRRNRRDDHLVPAVERDALGKLDALRHPARARAADRLQHFRHPQAERDRLAGTQRRRHRGRPCIERDDVAATIERNHRIRQPRQDRSDQRIPDAGRTRLVRFQGCRRLCAACACDQGRRGDERETCERRKRGDRTEHPQPGERERRDRQHQAHAPEALDPSADPDAIVSGCHGTPNSYGFACAATMTGVRRNEPFPAARSRGGAHASPVDGAVDGAVMGIVPSWSHAARR